MAEWARKINIQNEWDMALNDQITVQELAKVISTRLSEIKPLNGAIEEQRLVLIKEFEYLADSPTSEFEEFDYYMEQLYDWGDTSLDDRWNGKKVCWINVM